MPSPTLVLMDKTPVVPTESQLTDALRHLRRARDARARGGRDAIECIAYAETAYSVAQDAYFSVQGTEQMATAVEVMYQARACPGRMHRFRGEHESGLVHYRGALAVVEDYQRDVPEIRKWLGPAYHDCYVEARLCGHTPSEYTRWAQLRMETGNYDERLFAFIHDMAYLRAAVNSCEPRHLWNQSVAATFHTEDGFERMCYYANMCLAAGQMQNAQWFGRAVQRFDGAVDRLEHEEGVAMAQMDVAGGAYALGDRELAGQRLDLAQRIAEARDEGVLVERTKRQRVAYGLRAHVA